MSWRIMLWRYEVLVNKYGFFLVNKYGIFH